MKRFFYVITLVCLALTTLGQGGYKQPAKEILDVLNSPAIPNTSLSPSRDKIAILEPLRYPPIADLAQPTLRLPGTRFNPNTNAPHLQNYSISLRSFPEQL